MYPDKVSTMELVLAAMIWLTLVNDWFSFQTARKQLPNLVLISIMIYCDGWREGSECGERDGVSDSVHYS